MGLKDPRQLLEAAQRHRSGAIQANGWRTWGCKLQADGAEPVSDWTDRQIIEFDWQAGFEG